MALDLELARRAMRKVSDELASANRGPDPVVEAALGALQIQKYGMTQAIELNSVRRGYDPREFTLVAAGGAGPLFACDIALELGIARVLVPPHPGIVAATGLLATDLQHEFVATERHSLKSLDRDRLGRRYEELVAQAVAQLEADGVPDNRRLVRRLADCRYAGQGYEVRFDVPAGSIDDDWVVELAERFHRAHEAEYGHRFDAEIEMINVRAVAVGRVEKLAPGELEAGDGDPSRARTLDREVVFDVEGRPEGRVTPFFERSLLRAGDRIEGPAVLEQYDSTTVVPPGLSAEIDRIGNIVIDCATAPPADASRGTGLATPILMRVIGGAFTSIAKEMAGVLYRMSYSSIIRESEDLGAGIFDRDGNELAESDSTPMFMGAMPKIVKNVIRILGDDIADGDVILHNDPYGGATHSPDVAIVIPIFLDGELVGFSGASAHVLDIGGAYPGLAIDLVDNWSEGNIYRAVKLQVEGIWQERLWKHILENVRTATFNNGDIRAMIAACELAKRRYVELLSRYGKDAVLGAARAWLEYSEQMLRREIARVPDGRYETDLGWLDDDGRNRGKPLPIKVAVEISGDEITFDLTGSSGEVPTGYNCPFEGTTVSAMTFITRMIFLDEVAYPTFVPQNEGMLAPVHVVAPKGSIFNPSFPRACFARFCQVQRAVDLALRALAPVVPDKITAGNSAHLHFVSYSGFLEEEGEYWVYLEVDEGSYGGRPGRDGLDSVDCLIANTRNNPIEELEWRFPMRTERYELRDEPSSAGRWRGGIGMVRVNRFLEDTIVTCEGDRHDADRPWGIFGGHDGVNAYVRVTAPDGSVEHWPAKFTGLTLEAGSTIEIGVPNSGGYGDPLEREPGLVLADVLDGFTTVELAERDYGVVIDAETMRLDQEETARVREERAARPVPTA
jgi:5-oxoprolinase (ATP-hydrolysing)